MRANVGKKSDLFQRGKRNQKVSLSSCCRSTSIIPEFVGNHGNIAWAVQKTIVCVNKPCVLIVINLETLFNNRTWQP